MPQTKKQAILKAALDLFVEQGIDGTSIRAIAGEADTAEGNIYRHFRSKHDLARKLFLKCADKFKTAFENATEPVEDPEKKVEALVREIFNFSVEHRREFSFILVANHRKEIIDREILSKPLPKDLFVEILRDGIEKGVFRPVDPNIAVAWIVGMVLQSFRFMDRGMTPLPQPEVVEETVDTALRIIRA